jgi:hypothetical protein
MTAMLVVDATARCYGLEGGHLDDGEGRDQVDRSGISQGGGG